MYQDSNIIKNTCEINKLCIFHWSSIPVNPFKWELINKNTAFIILSGSENTTFIYILIILIFKSARKLTSFRSLLQKKKTKKKSWVFRVYIYFHFIESVELYLHINNVNKRCWKHNIILSIMRQPSVYKSRDESEKRSKCM